jgi:16S rRNA U516 pseudouridylate synthase RsuA-like enzyme
MFEAVGYRVERLLRIRIGNLRIGDLPCGHWRALTQRELKDLHSKDNIRAVAAGADRGR